jgi:hypothetical protein
MPTPTYELIGSTTLGTATGQVSFSSIPSTYRDLIVVVFAEGATSGTLNLRFNANATVDAYIRIRLSGDGTSVTSAATNNTNWLCTNAADLDNLAHSMIHIFEANQTDRHKFVLINTGRAAAGVDAMSGRWANTSAITSVDLYNNLGSSNFVVGSSFYLYGIVA